MRRRVDGAGFRSGDGPDPGGFRWRDLVLQHRQATPTERLQGQRSSRRTEAKKKQCQRSEVSTRSDRSCGVRAGRGNDRICNRRREEGELGPQPQPHQVEGVDHSEYIMLPMLSALFLVLFICKFFFYDSWWFLGSGHDLFVNLLWFLVKTLIFVTYLRV